MRPSERRRADEHAHVMDAAMLTGWVELIDRRIVTLQARAERCMYELDGLRPLELGRRLELHREGSACVAELREVVAVRDSVVNGLLTQPEALRLLSSAVETARPREARENLIQGLADLLGEQGGEA